MDVILQLIKIEGMSKDIINLINNLKLEINTIIYDIERETDIKVIHNKIHILKGFFSNKKIVNLLQKIRKKNDKMVILDILKKVKILIYEEFDLFN